MRVEDRELALTVLVEVDAGDSDRVDLGFARVERKKLRRSEARIAAAAEEIDESLVLDRRRDIHDSIPVHVGDAERRENVSCDELLVCSHEPTVALPAEPFDVRVLEDEKVGLAVRVAILEKKGDPPARIVIERNRGPALEGPVSVPQEHVEREALADDEVVVPVAVQVRGSQASNSIAEAADLSRIGELTVDVGRPEHQRAQRGIADDEIGLSVAPTLEDASDQVDGAITVEIDREEPIGAPVGSSRFSSMVSATRTSGTRSPSKSPTSIELGGERLGSAPVLQRFRRHD